MIVVYQNDVPAEVNSPEDPVVLKGKLYLQRLIRAETSGGIEFGSVRFSKGARTNSHTHDSSQILYVTEGKGIVGTKEKDWVITPGVVVFIPAGTVHWHGAAEEYGLTLVTLYNGNLVVTNEQR